MTVPDQDSRQTERASVSDAGEFLHHHTELPTTRPSQWLDTGLSWIGKAASWLWLVVTGVIIWAVVSRYLFEEGSVLLEEVQWHLAGIGWLLGLAYTLVVDDHVRVDVIHERLSLRAQGWIELFGLVFLLLPFLMLSINEMVPYAINSWSVDETSQAPAGLPNRWVLKFIIALAFALIVVAAVSRLLKVTALLFGFPRPIAVTSDNNNREEPS
ncbi:TRAP transporter small permease subunit [Marinobacter persicus]|uniref:TRAP transporter small permease protein n=1 Tax=Marinobacter persicus TaxID=930118 RepID=A0A2S6GA86_9GAMM|nr:TRAP transporter small permease subunit [Marinobacter persicus]PPK53399.1 TRAP-type mannitol/chloroaromatic compound transport system permease small subunit [Marinobacter persicus]PPK56236.1 TRAP-type mannitol/chloroaromatic compound transport system permease small subunit [Marinobacter persicus]PPK59831.1 TRAP-type mannitol/chloroaromatic compound transport system permease small subunit [Marinobacter persicus]